MNDLFLLAINLTRRCNLACAHCYLDAHTLQHGDPDELTTDEVRGLLDTLADRGNDTMVVLTGGEPLLRPDLETLLAHGAQRGLPMVVGTNGVMLTDQRVQALKTAGAMGVGISVDSLDPARHDAFRGRTGSWEKTLAGMDACRRHDLPFQVHFSVTETNAAEVSTMIDFARASGARVLNVFFLVCTGRGESMSDISPATYERVLRQLVDAQEHSQDLMIRARCAPHFKRIAYQHNPESHLTRAQGYEGGGCLAGIHYCRITPEGGVTACPYIPDEAGSIRATPFWEIWDHSPTFQHLRHPTLEGQCGRCEYRQLCGGCRARPLTRGDGLMGSDPWCNYQPQGGAVIQPLQAHDFDIAWTPEASKRLTRVPPFLRKMVKKRAEDYARAQGDPQVTPEHLATLSARRFGAATPAHPPTEDAATAPQPATEFPWTEQARQRLQAMPAFLRDGVRQVAEDVARNEGRLEINIKMLDRLEQEHAPGRTMSWTTTANDALEQALADKAPHVRMFLLTALENAAEHLAQKRRADAVECQHVEEALLPITGGVEWTPDAAARVEAAPDFVRAGIKKAAEFNARREGLTRITSDDLTRFRNRAMMRAVQRMKGFGMDELSFDAYDIAKTKVPRLKGNREADKRFDAIRDFVEAREHPGDLLGLGLLNQMKTELRNNKKARQKKNAKSR